ncbi:MAG: glycoside-pentoside-hexuronide (GPH):cation symporter [Eubacteriales bacterium]
MKPSKSLTNTNATKAYGIGAIGKDIVYAFVAGFLLYYLNTLYGISSVFIGTLFMIARIFDAFNDPFMGVVVSKTNTKFGKFRPWIFVGTFINAIALYFLFAIPSSLEGNSLLLYVSITYVLWGLTYTLMDIPFWSMIPNITSPGKERELMSVVGRSCAGLGFALPTALTMFLVGTLGGDNAKEGFRILALLISIIFLITSTITVLFVQEKNDNTVESTSVKEMFRSLLENDQALYIVITIVIFNASLYLTQNLALYFFEYDIGDATLFGVFGTVGGVAQILSMTALPRLRKRYSKHTLFMAAIVIAIAGYLFLFLLGTLGITHLIPLCIAAAIIFIGFGLATVLTTIFLADTVDYGEWKSGQRNDSVIFSLQTFVVKLASAISIFITGVGLDLIGLNIELKQQSSQTLLGLRFLMTILPIIGLILAIIIFNKKYTLSEERLKTLLQTKGEHS